MGDSPQPKTSRLTIFVLILIVVWLFLGLVSTIVMLGNIGFIPSAKWTAETRLPCIILGLLSAAFLVWAAWKGGKKAQRSELNLAVLGAAYLGYFAGSNILFIWPILLPLFAGHQVALPFTVLRATDFGGVKCRSPVVFEEMPFAHQYCGVPESVRSSLSPGERIVAVGWGTQYGLYAHGLQPTDVKGPRF
ncbi:hypothetical protein [Rhizobium sp. BK377]|jgi:hypothetical protein|uniref:hypothetical protein n=1 Tax=Rhizobium sp. BK377 TaxID=2587058 RepID=UPI00160E73EB|nr:hypothetical protein [Rhizobium sp. BK377]MBB3465280.1 hypothetical protein [Rhizobium sp. BK377]